MSEQSKVVAGVAGGKATLVAALRAGVEGGYTNDGRKGGGKGGKGLVKDMR